MKKEHADLAARLAEDDENYVPLKTYLRHTQRLSSKDGFFTVLRDYTRLMTPLEAMLLGDLVNREDIRINGHMALLQSMRMGDHLPLKKVKPPFDRQGFFLCSRKYLANPKFYPVWSVDVQNRLVPMLHEKGFITVKRRGHPGKRWIKVERKYLYSQIDRVQPDWTADLD